MIKYYIIIFCLFFSCFENIRGQKLKDTIASDTIEEQGIIKLNICSRGCYQYYIEYQSEQEKKYVYPDSLPGHLKKDNVSINFTGLEMNDSTELLKPGINDKPVLLKKIRNMHILKINMHNED